MKTEQTFFKNVEAERVELIQDGGIWERKMEEEEKRNMINWFENSCPILLVNIFSGGRRGKGKRRIVGKGKNKEILWSYDDQIVVLNAPTMASK